MPADEVLLHRVRAAFDAVPHVEEKRMFGGITFMVGGKMCVSVGRDRIMCRIDPDRHDELLEREGCRTVVMKGREYRGYLYVAADSLQSKRALDDWIRLALEYNRSAQASPRKRR